MLAGNSTCRTAAKLRPGIELCDILLLRCPVVGALSRPICTCVFGHLLPPVISGMDGGTRRSNESLHLEGAVRAGVKAVSGCASLECRLTAGQQNLRSVASGFKHESALTLPNLYEV